MVTTATTTWTPGPQGIFFSALGQRLGPVALTQSWDIYCWMIYGSCWWALVQGSLTPDLTQGTRAETKPGQGTPCRDPTQPSPETQDLLGTQDPISELSYPFFSKKL